MDNNFENNSDNGLENTSGNAPDNDAAAQSEQPEYTDPNADVQSGYTAGQSTENSTDYTYGQDTAAQSGGNPEQNSNYQGYWDNQNQGTQDAQYNQNQQYAGGGVDNYNYNVNSAPAYNGEEGYDTSPMTMGDWLLVLLASFIPCCGGIILYFVWAFSKKGNINRRNYCRAALIIQGAGLVLVLLIYLIMGSAILSSLNYYY